MRWFDLTTKIWFESTWFDLDLIWIYHDFIWVDLWFEEITGFCGLSYIIVKWIGYGPVNNRFFMDILPKYVASFFGNSGTPVLNLWRHHTIKAGSAEDYQWLCAW